MENNQTNTYMEETNSELVHTYNRFPVVLDHGEGVYLYDTEGKKYLDFAAGIAVCGLGYSNEEYKTALKNQIDLLTHTSNLYYNTTCGKAAKALLKACEMDKVFFTNSGTEAIEGALKAARKYAYKKGTGRYEFIAMEDSFHGRKACPAQEPLVLPSFLCVHSDRCQKGQKCNCTEEVWYRCSGQLYCMVVHGNGCACHEDAGQAV